MIKKFKWVIVTTIVLIAVTLFAISINQRQEQDVLLEQDVFVEVFDVSNGIPNRPHIYRFVIKDDGTFISYGGNSPDLCFLHLNNGNITLSDYDRVETVLCEQEFKHISELVHKISQHYCEQIRVSDWRRVILLYDKNIYGIPYQRIPIINLANELRQLSPL